MAALSKNEPYVILEDFVYDMNEEESRDIQQYCMLLSKSSSGWMHLNPQLNKDKLRKQFNMPEGGLETLTNARTKKTYEASLFLEIVEILRLLFPEHRPTDSSLLHSMKGCKQQHIHTDYDPALCAKSAKKPFGALYSLMESKFTVKYKLPNGQWNQECLFLPRNSLLVFRGDLLHAGEAFDHDNFRFHTYLDVEGIEHRESDETYLNATKVITTGSNSYKRKRA